MQRPSPALEGNWHEEGGEDGATGLCAEEGVASSQGGEPEPPQAEEVLDTDEPSPALEGNWQEEGGEDGATGLCAGVASRGGAPEPPQAEEALDTDETSPALEGVCGTPRPGASVEDDREPGAARSRRRERGRDAQVAHKAWWSEDAWRQGGEPWRNPRGSQWWRSGHAQAWRPRV